MPSESPTLSRRRVDRRREDAPRLLYCTAIEDTVRSPLLHSQVYSLLAEQVRLGEVASCRIISFYPVINWFRYRRQRRSLTATLAAEGIALTVVPIGLLSRHFYLTRRVLPIFALQARVAMRCALRAERPDLIHARSFPALLACSTEARRLRLPVIADLRNLYVEEAAVREDDGRPRFGPGDYRSWKAREARLLRSSEAVICTSGRMREELLAQYPDLVGRCHVINTVGHRTPRQSLDLGRAAVRSEFGIEDSSLVFAYAGTWFPIRAGVRLTAALVAALPDEVIHLVLVLARPSSEVEAAIVAAGRGRVRVHMTTAAPADVPKLLASADIGLEPAEVPSCGSDDPRFKRLAAGTPAVKFGEYLAAGLPVIVSPHHGGAAALARDWDVGFVMDGEWESDLPAWLQRWRSDTAAFRERCLARSAARFAPGKVARRYSLVYRRSTRRLRS